MSRIYHLSDEELALARSLRAQGISWNKIGVRLGVPGDVVRWRVDPDYVAAHRSAHGAGERIVHNYSYRLSERAALAAVSSVPRDTRSTTARAMGDPLPGRSALDKKRAKQGSPVGHAEVFHAIHSQLRELERS